MTERRRRRIVDRSRGSGGQKRPYALLGKCARAGLTNDQTAFVCGVTRQTLQNWLRYDKKASSIVRRGKQEPNLKIENSLYRRALGYNVVETIEKVVSNGNGEILKKIPILRKNKHVPASVKAIEVWLYNRDPDRWKKQAFLNVRNMSLKDKTELAYGGMHDVED